jgi:hypothetical protein
LGLDRGKLRERGSELRKKNEKGRRGKIEG